MSVVLWTNVICDVYVKKVKRCGLRMSCRSPLHTDTKLSTYLSALLKISFLLDYRGHDFGRFSDQSIRAQILKNLMSQHVAICIKLGLIKPSATKNSVVCSNFCFEACAAEDYWKHWAFSHVKKCLWPIAAPKVRSITKVLLKGYYFSTGWLLHQPAFYDLLFLILYLMTINLFLVHKWSKHLHRTLTLFTCYEQF